MRYKAFKFLTRNFQKGLVLILVVSIVSLAFYLKDPFIKTFFTKTPSTYSLSNFKEQYRYKVYQGDYLLGKNALPNSKIKVLITPGRYKLTIKADSKGDFVFQLPKEANLGKYRVTFADFDALRNLAWIKSYKVTVNSNNNLYQNPLFKSFEPKQAQAEEEIELDLLELVD